MTTNTLTPSSARPAVNTSTLVGRCVDANPTVVSVSSVIATAVPGE